jgi:hypothetical protein
MCLSAISRSHLGNFLHLSLLNKFLYSLCSLRFEVFKLNLLIFDFLINLHDVKFALHLINVQNRKWFILVLRIQKGVLGFHFETRSSLILVFFLRTALLFVKHLYNVFFSLLLKRLYFDLNWQGKHSCFWLHGKTVIGVHAHHQAFVSQNPIVRPWILVEPNLRRVPWCCT